MLGIGYVIMQVKRPLNWLSEATAAHLPDDERLTAFFKTVQPNTSRMYARGNINASTRGCLTRFHFSSLQSHPLLSPALHLLITVLDGCLSSVGAFG